MSCSAPGTGVRVPRWRARVPAPGPPRRSPRAESTAPSRPAARGPPIRPATRQAPRGAATATPSAPSATTGPPSPTAAGLLESIGGAQRASTPQRGLASPCSRTSASVQPSPVRRASEAAEIHRRPASARKGGTSGPGSGPRRNPSTETTRSNAGGSSRPTGSAGGPRAARASAGPSSSPGASGPIAGSGRRAEECPSRGLPSAGGRVVAGAPAPEIAPAAPGRATGDGETWLCPAPTRAGEGRASSPRASLPAGRVERVAGVEPRNGTFGAGALETGCAPGSSRGAVVPRVSPPGVLRRFKDVVALRSGVDRARGCGALRSVRRSARFRRRSMGSPALGLRAAVASRDAAAGDLLIGTVPSHATAMPATSPAPIARARVQPLRQVSVQRRAHRAVSPDGPPLPRPGRR